MTNFILISSHMKEYLIRRKKKLNQQQVFLFGLPPLPLPPREPPRSNEHESQVINHQQQWLSKADLYLEVIPYVIATWLSSKDHNLQTSLSVWIQDFFVIIDRFELSSHYRSWKLFWQISCRKDILLKGVPNSCWMTL